MPFNNILQPEIININEKKHLRKYDGNYEQALIGYQNPYVYQNSEGIFNDDEKPDLNYVKGMFEWLNNNGELYFIEFWERDAFYTIGDVTIKDVNPPIAIWYEKYRGIGIGTLVMKVVIERLKTLGFTKITGSTVYKWNKVSQKMHEKLGFECVKEDENELYYDKNL